MPKRDGNAVWNGGLTGGNGTIKVGDALFEGQYSFSSRFEEGEGTNPEELIASAHAGCYSMAFSAELEGAGFTPNSVSTKASVWIEKGDDGFSITRILLSTEGDVPGIDDAKFQEVATAAKEGCPVSRALSAVDISLEATLRS